MAEKLCEMAGNGGRMMFPDYQNGTDVVNTPSKAIINYTPTENGFMTICTDAGSFSKADIKEDNVLIGTAVNSITIFVRKGRTYTSDTAVRIAKFFPLV